LISIAFGVESSFEDVAYGSSPMTCGWAGMRKWFPAWLFGLLPGLLMISAKLLLEL